MKLYTKTGDDGSTGLFGGARVDKDHPRVEAYGTLDELNASLGLAASACGESAFEQETGRLIRHLQARLFDLGADLATPPDSKHADKVTRLSASEVTSLEEAIDRTESGNTPMTSFILPGGTELAARLHLARCVCRRAERLLVSLGRTDDINPQAIIFVNRLSDLLFAMGRRVNRAAGVDDIPWLPGS